MRALASRLFGMSAPVSRGFYLRAGLSLALLKYVVDVALVYGFTREWLTPLRYSAMSLSLALPHGAGQTALLACMALWAAPFLWIGMSMTLRRCADAQVHTRLALLFFVPIVSYLLMAALCFAETASGSRPETRPAFAVARRWAFLLGVMTGVGVLLTASALSVFALHAYGAMLFIGAPFVSGFVGSFVLTAGHREATQRDALAVGAASVVAAGTALLLVAWEGVYCLVMAMPLALLIALFGAVMGHALARNDLRGAPALVLLFAWPVLTAAEASTTQPEVRELLSVIEVERAPAEVWPHVIAFGELAPPSEWYFRGGIAYPQRARIRGAGVGAVRYCEFSTGPFVEPITVWDAPHRLAFSVASQPPPMSELSPYREVMAPHLRGNLLSRRGEFRLLELPGGRTRIEARTWYSIDMRPAPYWQLWSDSIIHAIHMRVLRHIAHEVEAAVPALDGRTR